jgi:cytosine/adenosine deaminase-related metal-dependent hydrolase
MKRVFDNAIVLYGEELEEIRGYVVVKDGIIDEVGKGSYFGEKEDVKGGIISPSFTNTHVHLGDSAGMDLEAYLPIAERVGKKGVKYEAHKRSDAKEAVAAALSSMKKSGTTAFCDFREGGLEGIELIRSVQNMAARILGRPLGDEDVFEFCDGLGISSITDYTNEKLERMLQNRKGKLVGIHAGEARDDVLEALEINPDFVVHLTNAGKVGLGEVFERKIPIVLCPRANASFGVGIADLKSIFNSDNLVALGTDNVMANSPDLLRESEFIWKLYRGLYKDHSFDAKMVLKAATINGRKILGLPNNTIKEGKQADFIVTRPVNFAEDPILALVHRIAANEINEVVAPPYN